MFKKMGLVVLFSIVLHAKPFSPKTTINISFSPLFPSNQKMYVAKEFIVNSDDLLTPLDTLIHIKDYVNFMNGYTVGVKFGEFTSLNLGINLKFEHFFNRYFNSYFDEFEGRLDSIPVNMNLFLSQGGLSSSLKLTRNFLVEPEINLLYAESYFKYFTRTREDGYGPYVLSSIGKMGLFTGIKLIYLKSDNINFGSNIAFLFYSEINDLMINPFLQIKLYKRLKCHLGLNYSFLTNAINPNLGLNYTLFKTD